VRLEGFLHQTGKLRYDVLANGSPIGMSPLVDAMAVSEAAVSKASLVFDAIYTPPKTKLLKVISFQGNKPERSSSPVGLKECATARRSEPACCQKKGAAAEAT